RTSLLSDPDWFFARHAELAADALLDRLVRVRIVLEELLGVFAALAETLAAVGEPRAAFLDDPLVDGQVEQIARARDALAVHHVELGLAEGRRDLVLHDLHARPSADDDIAVLDARDAADVHTDRGVELQRPAAGGGFRIAEHPADLLAQLVDEDQAAFRPRHGAGELPQRLRHEPRLQAHLRFAHLTFDFRLRHQRGHRVDDHHVDAVRADEDLDDLERLLAVVGLRHEQVVDVDPQLLRVDSVERMLGVHERGHPAHLLCFRNHLERERGLARRLGPEDFDDAAARDAADAEGVIDADGSGRNRLDRLDGPLLAQAHDRALAKLLLNLAEGNVDCFLTLAILTFVSFDRHVGESSGSAAILNTCRAKVKRHIVNMKPEADVNQHFTSVITFAPRV